MLLGVAGVLVGLIFLLSRKRRSAHLASSRSHNRSSSVLLSAPPEAAEKSSDFQIPVSSDLVLASDTPRAARTSLTLARTISNASTLVGTENSILVKKCSHPSALTSFARSFSFSARKSKQEIPEIRITFPEEYDSDDSNYSSDSNTSFDTGSPPPTPATGDLVLSKHRPRQKRRKPRCVVVEISESGPAFVRDLVESDDDDQEINIRADLLSEQRIASLKNDPAAGLMLHDVDLNTVGGLRENF